MASEISKELFESRVQRLVQQWPWPSADALLILSSSSKTDSDDQVKEPGARSVCGELRATGRIQDLVLLVERSGKVTAISTSKKLNHLQKLSLSRVPCEKTFTQDDRQKLLDVLRAVPAQSEKLVVALPSEIHFGPIQEEANKTISAADFLQITDAIPGLKLLLASKDEQEVLNCKRAAHFGCHYMQEIVVNKWMEALDQELTISHFAIVSQLQELADKEDVMKELCTKLAVDASAIEVANHLLQSGRSIDLTFGALPSKGDLAMWRMDGRSLREDEVLLMGWGRTSKGPPVRASLLSLLLAAALRPAKGDLDFKAFTRDPQGYASHIRVLDLSLVDGSQIEYFSDEFNELCTQVSHAIL
ncbi:FACT complex subunit spt16 [Symbiodinium microadriaticum]|uniref:FACT complex subunit n=1 Tax=Symbiodinium microadriaticum TaxID=2951 RepID=A0A1Q9DGS1_SYMMI|nr:FACT complex subunit spt16 [Symbiodinium microadriaticum]